MLLLNLLSNPIVFIGFILALTIAISVHEAAHAWTASLLGDQTAKINGRVTLNPLAHLDITGTVFLLLAGFGWGKPVPINSNNFKNPKFDELKVALSGPLSNLLTAMVFSLLVRFIPIPYTISLILVIIIQINIVLMVFNLLPIPPLDGSTILKIFLPEESWHTIQQYSTPLLFAFLIFAFTTPHISNLISTLVGFLMTILLGNNFWVL